LFSVENADRADHRRYGKLLDGGAMPEIHIEITCQGDGFPTVDELAMRNDLEDALESANIGEVVDSGGGMGVMDIFLEVADIETAITRTTAIVKQLGLGERATVQSAE
jgi:hypothetical protein